jgi:hypothetical protein
MKENPKPDANTTMRTASGHIHIGFKKDADVASEEHMIKCATLVKHLDLFLGIRSLEWDKDRHVVSCTAIREQCGSSRTVLSIVFLVISGSTEKNWFGLCIKQTLRCIDDLKANGALDIKDYEKIAFDIEER